MGVIWGRGFKGRGEEWGGGEAALRCMGASVLIRVDILPPPTRPPTPEPPSPDLFLGRWDVESVLVRVDTPLGPEMVPDLAPVARAREQDLNAVQRYQVGGC